MKLRKLLFIVLVLVLALGLLPLKAQDEPVTMTMWIRDTNFLISTLVDTWNENNANQIELTIVPAEEFVSSIW